MDDSMFYIKKEGNGVAGMELIDGMRKVDEMVKKYEQEKCIYITVMKGMSAPLADSVDDDGVLFPSQESAPLADYDSEMEYLYTQQSTNFNNAKQIIPVQEDYISTQQKGKSVCETDSENDGDVGSDVDPAMDSDEEM